MSLVQASRVKRQDIATTNIAALQAVSLLLPVDLDVVAVHRGLKGLVGTHLCRT